MKQAFALALILSCYTSSAQIATGNSLAIPGNGQYVQVADASSATVSQSMTIEAWVYYCCSTSPNGASVLTKGWCGSTYGYYFMVDDNDLIWGWQRTGTGSNCTSVSVYRTSSNPIPYNAWTHVAVVHTATGVALYVNGVAATASLTQGSYGGITLSGEPLRIGAYRRLDGAVVEPMIGRVDDLRIWNTARTATEIQAAYTSELTGSETGLVAYYKLNETGTGTGITVANSAASTTGLYNGTTVGANVSFQSNSATPICYTGTPPSACAAVLSVALEDFMATAVKDGARLDWSVASKEAVKEFAVQRSEDGAQFKTLAHVGIVPRQHHYTFTDAEAIIGRHFYRIALKEQSGRTSFSNVATVDVLQQNALRLSPLPANQNLTIHLSSDDSYEYTVLGMDGRQAMHGTMRDGHSTLDVSRLPAGWYVLRVASKDGFPMQQRFLVAH